MVFAFNEYIYIKYDIRKYVIFVSFFQLQPSRGRLRDGDGQTAVRGQGRRPRSGGVKVRGTGGSRRNSPGMYKVGNIGIT